MLSPCLLVGAVLLRWSASRCGGGATRPARKREKIVALSTADGSPSICLTARSRCRTPRRPASWKGEEGGGRREGSRIRSWTRSLLAAADLRSSRVRLGPCSPNAHSESPEREKRKKRGKGGIKSPGARLSRPGDPRVVLPAVLWLLLAPLHYRFIARPSGCVRWPRATFARGGGGGERGRKKRRKSAARPAFPLPLSFCPRGPDFGRRGEEGRGGRGGRTRAGIPPCSSVSYISMN